MTIYKSKLGFEIIIPLLIALSSVLFIMAYNKIWAGLIIFLLLAAFVSHMFLTTYYIIDGKTLKIKCGFLCNKSVDIGSIRKITETNNPISSPATSLGRLEIKYNKYDSVIISPKDKNDFINSLIKLKPDIEVRLKKNKIV